MFQASLLTGLLFLAGIALGDWRHALWVLLGSIVGMLLASHHTTAAVRALDPERLVERSLFENLARQTGGASFNLRDMRKTLEGPPGGRIFEVLRSHYTVTVSGNLSLGEKLKVEVQRPAKLAISALPLE